MDDDDDAVCDYCESTLPASELRSTPLPKDRPFEHGGICCYCWTRVAPGVAWPASRAAQAQAEREEAERAAAAASPQPPPPQPVPDAAPELAKPEQNSNSDHSCVAAAAASTLPEQETRAGDAGTVGPCGPSPAGPSAGAVEPAPVAETGGPAVSEQTPMAAQEVCQNARASSSSQVEAAQVPQEQQQQPSGAGTPPACTQSATAEGMPADAAASQQQQTPDKAPGMEVHVPVSVSEPLPATPVLAPSDPKPTNGSQEQEGHMAAEGRTLPVATSTSEPLPPTSISTPALAPASADLSPATASAAPAEGASQPPADGETAKDDTQVVVVAPLPCAAGLSSTPPVASPPPEEKSPRRQFPAKPPPSVTPPLTSSCPPPSASPPPSSPQSQRESAQQPQPPPTETAAAAAGGVPVVSPPRRQFPSKPPPPPPPQQQRLSNPPEGSGTSIFKAGRAFPRHSSMSPIGRPMSTNGVAIGERNIAHDSLSESAMAALARAELKLENSAAAAGEMPSDRELGFRTISGRRPLLRTERSALLDSLSSLKGPGRPGFSQDDSGTILRVRSSSGHTEDPTIMREMSPSSPQTPPHLGLDGAKSSSFTGRVGSLRRLVLRDTSISRPSSNTGVDSDSYRPRLPDSPSDLLDGAVVLRSAAAMNCSLPWTAPALADCWTTVSIPQERWSRNTGPCGVVSAAVLADGFHVESSRDSVTSDYANATPFSSEFFGILASDGDEQYFQDVIYPNPHEHWCADDVIVSVEEREIGVVRAVVRTKKQTQRVLLPASRHIKALKTVMPKMKNTKFVRASRTAEMSQALIAWDKRNTYTTFKFGVLLCKPNQHDESEIFSNLEADASPAYMEFLEFLGEIVTLKGWTKYRGGLDVRDNNTGERSVYASVGKYEIMYHVATMLPFQPGDAQRVERKRHIGNDVCVIIFKEQADADDTVNPKIFTSHFNHSFFVVSPVLDSLGSCSYYRLSIANKPAVPPYPPFFPSRDIMFEKGPAFREFLLKKLINAERSALWNSPEFSSLMATRKMQLGDLCGKYL